jgi:hypothetical protein
MTQAGDIDDDVRLLPGTEKNVCGQLSGCPIVVVEFLLYLSSLYLLH